MYFEDLTAYRYYLPSVLSNVRNVGWLDANHAYPKGEVAKNFVSKLREIICARLSRADVHVNVIREIHPCNLCGDEHIEIHCPRLNVLLGMSEIWIPSTHGYFASPSMVLHFIEEHGYMPPQEYIDAVMLFDLHESFNAQEIYDTLVAKLGN